MNIIHRNSVKRNAVSLFLASIFLFLILYQGVNQPSSLFDESTDTTILNSPTSANTDYEQSITGAGNDRSVRLFMDNKSSASGVDNFNISSDNSNNYLNKGQYNLTISENFDTNYTLEDNSPLEYPLEENSATSINPHGFIENIPNSSVSNSLILNATAKFTSGIYEKNILGFQVELTLTSSKGFLLSTFMRNNDSQSYQLLETYSSEAVTSHDVRLYVRNENLLYLNSTDDAEFSFLFTNATEDFSITIESISISAVKAYEIPIYEGGSVALEFDTKGEATVYGFYAWVRSFNTTDSGYDGNLTIQLYDSNLTATNRTRYDIIEYDYVGSSLITPDTSIAPRLEYTFENYTSDKPTWFGFENNLTGDSLEIGNYYIVISSNVSENVGRGYSLVTIPYDSDGLTNELVDHLLLENGTLDGEWQQVEDSSSSECDAALFAINLTRAYYPEEIGLKIENEVVSSTYTFNDSIAYNVDDAYPQNQYDAYWWGCGTIDHVYDTPIPTTNGIMQVNLTWDTDIYSGPIEFEVEYGVQKYFDEIATTSFNLTLEELPAWNVNYTYDSTVDRFVNWTLMEAWYFIPMDWEVSDFMYNATSYLANISYPTTVDEQQVVKVQTQFIVNNGTYELQATSPNYVQNCEINLNYLGNLWPTNGFMVGDNISISVGVLDSNDKYVASGEVTASLFNTTGHLETSHILTDNSIDENSTFSQYLFELNNSIINSVSTEGEYNVIVNWSNGEEAGILRRPFYVNKYVVPSSLSVSYKSSIASNQVTASIGSFDTDLDKNNYNVYLYAVREAGNEIQIDQETEIQMLQNVFLTNYLQNETFFNSGENVTIEIDLENRHPTLSLDVNVKVQLVYQNNPEMVIVEGELSKSLAIYGVSSELDKQKYEYDIKIPAVEDGGLNCPIRNAPMQINIIADIDGDEIYSGIRNDVIYYSSIEESIFDGEILDYKEFDGNSGPAFIGNMARTNLELPETLKYFIQIENDYFITLKNEINSIEILTKINGSISELAIAQSDITHTSVINLVGKVTNEYNDPLIGIPLNLYYDNTPSNETDEWIRLKTPTGDLTIDTDDEGSFDVEIDLSQVPIDILMELKVEFAGDGDTESFSETIEQSMPEYDSTLSIVVDSTRTIITNSENIIEVKITNVGDTTIKNLTIEIEDSLFDITEIFGANPFERLALKPAEECSVQIRMFQKSYGNDTVSFNLTIQGIVEETGEELKQSRFVEMDVYSVNENQVLITTAIVIFIGGTVLFWIYGAIYIKKKVNEINAPITPINDVKKAKSKRRVGKYVPISELSTKSDQIEKSTEESTTSLDDLLEQDEEDSS